MQKRERDIEERFCERAKEVGALCLKFAPPGSAGWPDRLLLYPNAWAEFVEFKAPGEKPRKLQEKRIAALRAMGYTVTVIDSIKAVTDYWEGVGWV